MALVSIVPVNSHPLKEWKRYSLPVAVKRKHPQQKKHGEPQIRKINTFETLERPGQLMIT